MKLYEKIIHGEVLKDGDFFTVEKDPTPKEFWSLLNNSHKTKLRGLLIADTGILYVWDAYWGIHTDIYDEIIFKDKDASDNYVQIYFYPKEVKSYGFSPYLDDIKEKYYGDSLKPIKRADLDKEIEKLKQDDEYGLLK